MKDDNGWYEERERERKRRGTDSDSLGVEMLRQSDSAFWLVLGGMAVQKAASVTAGTIFKKEETPGQSKDTKADRMLPADDTSTIAYSVDEMPPEIAATMSRQKKELTELYEMAQKAAATVTKIGVNKG